MPLRKKNGRIDHGKLAVIVGLLRNSFIHTMSIQCFDNDMDAFVLMLLRQLQNCHVRYFELKCPTASDGKQMLLAAQQKLRPEEYELQFDALAIGTPAWKELVFLDLHVQHMGKPAFTTVCFFFLAPRRELRLAILNIPWCQCCSDVAQNELFQATNREKPFHLEWIDALRVCGMGDLEEVQLTAQGMDDRAESMLDRLVEVGASCFPCSMTCNTT